MEDGTFKKDRMGRGAVMYRVGVAVNPFNDPQISSLLFLVCVF